MAFLLHVPAEASFVGLPAAIDELEALVKSHRASGDYTSAGRLQKQVEAQKSAEERSRLAVSAGGCMIHNINELCKATLCKQPMSMQGLS
jgi:hypothetical protein